MARRPPWLFLSMVAALPLVMACCTQRVPPDGTHWNFSFSGGPGLEIPLGRRHHLLVGASYHHISNALGHESPRNPSQNDARIWVGFGWTF